VVAGDRVAGLGSPEDPPAGGVRPADAQSPPTEGEAARLWQYAVPVSTSHPEEHVLRPPYGVVLYRGNIITLEPNLHFCQLTLRYHPGRPTRLGQVLHNL